VTSMQLRTRAFALPFTRKYVPELRPGPAAGALPRRCHDRRMPDEYLTASQLAAELQLSPRTLANWRWSGGGPPFVKVGAGAVRYRRRDVDSWLAKRTYVRTHEPLS
jgi:predicted DNA-binding transcriptional regulator AlpA